MTRVERLQAAIEKLERLKAVTSGLDYDQQGFVINYGGDQGDPQVERFCVMDRTLDAVLNALKGAHRYMQAFGDDAHDYVIALADSILGLES